eukprot:tig00020801_g13979.t1
MDEHDEAPFAAARAEGQPEPGPEPAPGPCVRQISYRSYYGGPRRKNSHTMEPAPNEESPGEKRRRPSAEGVPSIRVQAASPAPPALLGAAAPAAAPT